MTKLSNHQSGQTTKLLLIGDSGSGKSGALASLASAGYELWIVDVDNGIDVLKNLLLDKNSPYSRESADRVHFLTITDPMKQSGGKLIPKEATVWQRVSKLLSGDDSWGEEGKKKALDMTSKDVLVIDSLTFLSKAALNFVLQMNGRLGARAHQSDWYDGQLMIEGLLEMLYDVSVKCNVIVISHIVYIGEENGPQQGYPATLGKALSPKVGRYFNSVLQAKTMGVGQNRKRVLIADTAGMVELKNSSPLTVKKEYALGSGLADFFKDVRQGVTSPVENVITLKIEAEKVPTAST